MALIYLYNYQTFYSFQLKLNKNKYVYLNKYIYKKDKPSFVIKNWSSFEEPDI